MPGSDFDAGRECAGMAVARSLAFQFRHLAAFDRMVQGLASLGSAGIGDPGMLFGGARSGLRLRALLLSGVDCAGKLVEPVLLLESAGYWSRFARRVRVPVPPPERAGAVNQPLTGNKFLLKGIARVVGDNASEGEPSLQCRRAADVFG